MGLLLSMDVARSWAALATRPAVVRVLNLGLGGGLTGILQERWVVVGCSQWFNVVVDG